MGEYCGTLALVPLSFEDLLSGMLEVDLFFLLVHLSQVISGPTFTQSAI